MPKAAFILFALVLAGCKRPSASRPEPEPFAVKVLVQHLVDAKRVVSSAAVADETIWTDAAILEHAKTLPATLRAHLDAAPAGPVSRDSMTGLLQRLESEQATFQAATVKRVGNSKDDCRIVAGDVEAAVNCVYVDYIHARYPKAQLLVKGKYEPVLFVEGRSARGALMPMKLPDQP